MITFENIHVTGIEPAVRGMRNSWNSWGKSDSRGEEVGPCDLELMERLCKAGPSHRKFMRMIEVYVDITAPLYFWKEFDTYKVGTVCNSCSTMHTLTSRQLTLDDFSVEHLNHPEIEVFMDTILFLNSNRDKYLKATDIDEKTRLWNSIIQMLPSSYNQRRTILLSYEVIVNILQTRSSHKLTEWKKFCTDFIKLLKYPELITAAAGL